MSDFYDYMPLDEYLAVMEKRGRERPFPWAVSADAARAHPRRTSHRR